MSTTTSHRPNGRVALAGDFERVSLVENSDVTINPARSYMDVDIKTTNSFKSLALSALKMDMSRPISGSFVHNTSLKERRAYLSYVLGKEEFTPASEASKALSSQPSSGVSSSGDSDVDSSDNESDSSDPTSPAAGAVDFSGPSPSSDSFLEPPEGSQSTNVYSFLHNKLPAGVAVDGEATFSRSSNGSTFLELQPHSSLLVRTNVLEAPSKNGKMNSTYEYSIEMEIQLPSLPSNSLSLLQGLDNEQGLPSEGVVFIDRFGCVGTRGKYSSKQSGHAVVPGKWTTVKLTVQRGKGANTAIIEARIDGDLAVSVPIPSVDSTVSVSPKELWLFRSSSSSFMPGVRIRNVRVGRESTRTATEDFNLLRERIEAHDTQLFTHMSLRTLFRRPPPAWMHPIFECFLPSSSHVPKSDLSVLMPVLSLIFEQVCSNSVMLSSLSEEKRASLASQLAFLQDFKVTAKVFQDLVNLSSESAATIYVKHISKQLGVLKVGERAAFPFKHKFRAQDSHFVSDYIVVVEHTADSFYCLTVVDVDIDGGLRYHPCSMATPNEVRYKVCLPVANIPRESILDDAFWVSLAALSWSSGDRDSRSLLYTRLLPTLSPGLSFAPLAAILPTPTEVVPTPAEVNPLHAHGIALQASSAAAVSKSNSAAVGDITRAATELGVDISSFPEEDEAFRASTTAMYSAPADSSDPFPEAEFRQISTTAEATCFGLLSEMFYFVLRRSGLCPAEAGLVFFALRSKLLDMAFNDHSFLGALSKSDKAVLTGASGALARDAVDLSEAGILPSGLLSTVLRAVKVMNAAVAAMPPHEHASDAPPPTVQLTDGGLTFNSQHSLFPLAERIARTDDPNSLVGDRTSKPVAIPIDFLRVPLRATTFPAIVDALRHCDRICATVISQASLIKNPHHLVTALIEDTITRVVPSPRSPGQRGRDSCVWSNTPMTYSTQVEVMLVLERIALSFLSASYCITTCRATDTSRIVLMQVLAMFADALMRAQVSDIPSELAETFIEEEFGFRVGAFLYQAEISQFHNPELMLARANVLDYFEGQSVSQEVFVLKDNRGDHGTFAWVYRVCQRMGFPTSALHDLVIGDHQTLLVLNYPEFGAFRTICFWAKIVLSTSPVGSMPLHQTACQLSLGWSGKQYIISISHSQFSIKHDKDHRFPSPASLAKLAFPLKPKTEDDILHIPTLTSFNGALGQADSELLHSYLTVPYLRIPLFLGFLASNPDRVHALKSPELCDLFDAVIFEPGTHLQMKDELIVPTHVPALPRERESLASPYGLLINELVKSPSFIGESLQNIIMHTLSLDTGTVKATTTTIILYVLRLTTRIENYMSFVLALATGSHESISSANLRFDMQPAEVEALRLALSGLQALHQGRIRAMLEEWNREIQRDIYLKISVMGKAKVDEKKKRDANADSLRSHTQSQRAKTADITSSKNAAGTDVSKASDALSLRDSVGRNRVFHQKSIGLEEEERKVAAMKNVAKDSHFAAGTSAHTGLNSLKSSGMGHELDGMAPDATVWTPESLTLLSCVVHLHLMLIHRNTSTMHAQAALALTSSMMFLTTHHTWGPPLADIDGVGTLAVPEPHVYELMQKQRRHLIAFLSSRRQSTLNRIMDTTVRVTTLVGSIGDTKDKSGITGDDDLAGQARAMFHRSWGRVSGIQNRGKFALPARSDAFLKLEKQRSKNDLQEEDGSAGEARMNASTLDMSASGSTREIPELANGLELDADVDLQLLQLTFKSAHLSALPSAVAQASDIVDLFGNGTIQCALVEIAERRQWYRLVGRGYDVQRWTYRSHEPSYASEREYEPSELFSHEDWIAQIFEPIRLQFFNDPFNPRLFFMPTEKTQVNADIALVSVVDKNNGRFVCDVFVYKNRKMAHVYVTKSVGGRFYRVLVYASNAQFSLYHMQPSTGDRDTLWPFWSRHAAGHPENDDPAFSYSNVTITRDPEVEENLSGETETYLPSRVLRGILPHALLDKYRFWQDEKDNLRGYPIDESSPHIVCVDLIDLKRTDGTEEPGISARITRVLRKTLLSRLLARVNSVRLASKEKQRRAMREGADPTGGDDDGLTDAERRAAHQRAHLSVLKERGTTSSDFLPDDSTADEQLIAERDLHQHYDRRFKEKILEEERRAERRAAKRSAAATDDERKTTLDEEELELVNLLHTPRYGSLYQLASLLSRVDSLSHVLAWKRLGDKPSVFPEDKLLFDPTAAPRSGSTKAAHGTVKFAKSEEELTADAINELQLRIGQCVELPLVELPRVGLSFHYKADPRGEMRLYSLDHADLFVSNKRSELMSKLILGIPHALLLSNHNDEMSILVPCFCVVRPFIRNSPLSTELVIDRANTEWLEKLDSRYFLYPVHVSLSFVFTPTLASALYLMLLRFLNRNYLETFRLADTISTDTDFSVEESQIFSALGEAYTDQCPDAEACRLKISHATIDGDVPTPWVPVFVAANYAGSLPFISATCRLPLHAELYVLRKVVSAADLPLISRLFAIDSSFKAIRMVTAINRLQLLTAMHFKRPSYVVRAAPGRALAPVYSVSAPQIETLIIAAGHSLEAPLADNEEEIVSDKEEEDSDDDEPLPVPRDNDPYSLREFMNLQDAGTVEPIVENIVDYASMTMEQRIEAFQQAYKHSDLKQQDELAFQMSVSDAVDASKKKTSDPLTKKKKRSGPKMGNLKRHLVNSISTLFDDGGKPFQGFSASNALAAHPDARVEAAPLLSMTKKIDNSLLKERVLPAVVSTNTVSLFSKSITGSNGGLGNSTTTSGFVLLYSLLCGHVRARVKTSDCGQSLARLSFFSSPDFSVPSKGALLLRILCLRPDVASVMPSWKEFCKGKGPFSVNDFIDTAIGVLAKLYQVDPKLVLPPAPIYPPPTEAIANGRKKAAARRALRLQDPDSGLSKVFPKLPLPSDFDALFVVSEPPKLRGFEREDVPAETRVISGTGERWACEPAVNKFGNDDVSEFYGFSSGTQKRKKNEGSKDSYIKTMKRAAAVSTVEGILPTAAQFAWVLPSAPRAWVIPRLSDYACSERFFIPEQSVTVVKQAILDLSRGLSKKRTNVESIDGLSADVLGPLFDSPLTPAELDHFVASATRASKGLPPISAELPFDVSSHPEAQSSIAVSMQRRLTDDISLYAHLQNTGREPIVSGLGETEANAIATFAAGATEIQQKIRENLNALSTALLALRKRDSAFVDHALGLVTRLANHVALPPPLLESQASFIPKTSLFVMNPVVGAFFDGRTTKENEATTERLKFELRRIAGQEAELWTDFLIGSLLSSRAAFDIQKVNPYCTTDRVRAVLVLVEALLLHANRIGQINRCLQEASDLETLLARAEASAASGTASEGVKSAFAAGLLQKSQTLARLLTSSRHYVDRVPPSQCAESATAVSADEELQSSEHGEAAADSRMRTLGAHIRPRDPRFDERAALALSIDALISQNVAAPVCALSEKNKMEQMLERIHIDPADVAPVNDIIDSAVSIGALSTTERALAAVQVLPRTSSQADVSGVHSYDPRFLVFEFTWNILLRKTQVTMVREFSDSIRSGKSTVKQMIMGAGKTTVVAPLLTLMFGDGKTLVMEVVPPALLEFSRSVMRSTFSTVMYKRVSTFFFDRASIASQVMLDKIRTAVVERGVVISTPTSVKSVMLKLLEIQKILSDPSLPRPPALESQRDILVKMLLEFKRGVLFMDEVDLILHPLKSELNFPIGPKHDLDFNPLRWRLAMHIIDAVFYSESQVVPFDFRDSKRAIVILEAFNSAVQRGHTEKHLQSSPHLILLNEEYYQSTLLPILTDWVMLWLESNHTSGVSPADMRAYITASGAHDAELTTRISDNVAPKHIQALNLARDWLRSYAPHVLQKIDRVSFGLLSAEDLRRNLTRDPYMPVTRAKLAIPFLGKDVPSESSEFAHPDVIIGLTYMAYRYEGLRYIDFLDVIDNIRSAFSAETGPPAKRPSSLRYARWVAEAGGSVRGQGMEKEILQSRAARLRVAQKHESSGFRSPSRGVRSPAVSVSVHPQQSTLSLASNDDVCHASQDPTEDEKDEEIIEDEPRVEVLSLRLLKRSNVDQMSTLFDLLCREPTVIQWHLNEALFPTHMRHQHHKISASGVEIGGDMLFARRVGFSGTPSDLLPLELGSCGYEKASDGQMMSVLTSPEFTSFTHIAEGWTVQSLLTHVATARAPNGEPAFHALIDTGALITGMSNYDVAAALLDLGLKWADGVVFLDELDRKMILIRATRRVVKLQQCGIPVDRRFAFYDQVHTTGMDISHRLDACAAITLGKDMTFRDYAQGAYRMRGLSKGQTVHLLVTPEIHRLLNRQLKLCATASVTIDDFESYKGYLQAVTAWLVVNSMRSERIQFSQLCLQNIGNVWRKAAFAKLVRSHSYFSLHQFRPRSSHELEIQTRAQGGDSNSVVKSKRTGDGGDTSKETAFNTRRAALRKARRERMLAAKGITMAEFDETRKAQKAAAIAANEMEMSLGGRAARKRVLPHDPLLEQALSLFSEPIDFSIKTEVPKLRVFSESVQQLVDAHSAFISTTEQSEACGRILGLIRHGAMVDEGHLTAEMVQTMEEEKEKQQEQEQEQEIEIEKCVDAAYSRDNEAQTPWLFSALASPPSSAENASLFYPASDFKLYKRSPIKLSPSLYVSNNYFDKRWSGARRIKNTIMYLEWIPDAASLTPFTSGAEASHSDPVKLLSHYSRQISLLTKMFDEDGSGDLNATELAALLRAATNEPNVTSTEAEAMLSLMAGKDEKFVDQTGSALTNAGIVGLLTSGILSPGERGRFFLTISLAEAETLRRILHSRLNLPLLQDNPGFQLALRCTLYENAIFDKSFHFGEGPKHQRLMAWKSLQFLDSQTHFDEAGINILLNSMDADFPDARRRFFDTIMSCRRRMQKRAADAPVNRVFVLPSRFHLLSNRAVSWRLASAIKSVGLQLYDAFRAFDTNKNGTLSPDEIYGAAQFLRLPAMSVDDVLDYTAPVDPAVGWSMLYKGFSDLLRDPDVPIDTSSVDDEEQDGGDLPEVPPVDPVPFLESISLRQIAHAAGIKQRDLRDRADNASYARLVQKFGSVKPKNGGAPFQENRIPKENIRDETGGVVAEAPQFPIQSGETFISFFDRTLPHGVSAYGDSAAFVSDPVGQGQHRTFLRLGNAGLTVKLPATIQPNQDLVVSVAFRPCSASSITHARRLREMAAARAERRASETPEQRNARREARREAHLMKSGAQTASTEASTVNSIRRSLFSLSKKKGASATSVSSPTAIRNSVGVEATGTVIDSSDLDSDSDDDRATLHQEATLKALQGEKRDAEARVNSKVVPSFNQFLAADDEERYEIPLFTTLSPSLDAKHVLYHTKRNIASMYPPMIDSAPHKMPLNPKDSFSVVAARCSHGTADLQVFINNRICQSYPIRGNVSFRPTVGLFIAPEGAKIGEPFVDVIAVLVSQENPNKDTRMLKWLEDTARATESHQHFLGSHSSAWAYA